MRRLASLLGILLISACSAPPPPPAAPPAAPAAPAPPPPAPPTAPEPRDLSPITEELEHEDETVRELAKRCLDDDGAACEERGTDLYHEDPKRALVYYEHGCDLGEVPGCFGVASLISKSKGVIPHDFARAGKLLGPICESGHRNSCSLLGLMIYWGKGQPADPPASAPYFRVACDKGETQVACFNLAMMMADGAIDGGNDEASRLFERGCKGGYGLGCYNAAVLARQGARGHGDDEALRWFDLACKRAYPDGCTAAKRLRKPRPGKAPTMSIASSNVSKVPTIEEWNAAEEVVVQGASALGCEAKMVREWLRVSCRGRNASGGKPTTLSVTAGGRLDTYSFVGPALTSLVTAFLPGRHLEVDFHWTDGKQRLVVDWPKGAPEPQAKGAFAPL